MAAATHLRLPMGGAGVHADGAAVTRQQRSRAEVLADVDRAIGRKLIAIGHATEFAEEEYARPSGPYWRSVLRDLNTELQALKAMKARLGA